MREIPGDYRLLFLHLFLRWKTKKNEKKYWLPCVNFFFVSVLCIVVLVSLITWIRTVHYNRRKWSNRELSKEWTKKIFRCKKFKWLVLYRPKCISGTYREQKNITSFVHLVCRWDFFTRILPTTFSVYIVRSSLDEIIKQYNHQNSEKFLTFYFSCSRQNWNFRYFNCTVDRWTGFILLAHTSIPTQKVLLVFFVCSRNLYEPW